MTTKTYPLSAIQDKEEMTPEERIDAALDSVLKASGSGLKHYTMEKTLTDMRNAMRKIMSDSYISGSNAAIKVMNGEMK